MSGWQGSDRRERLPPDWERRRRRVLIRDGRRCTWVREDTGKRCGAEATEVDHIRRGDDHDVSNLRALCSWHHQRKSSAEGAEARARARRRIAKRFVRTEVHPGLL